MLKYIAFILLLFQSLEIENVYFTRNISSSSVVEIFKKLNYNLKGNIGLKVHTGEKGGKYFLTPDFLQDIYDYTNGTFIECNTAYVGSRHSTILHRELLKYHGWTNNSRRFVIMDEDPTLDFNLTISNPEMISKNIVGSHLKDFDSCLVLAHFKGHGMGGYGGALKQLSIGFASQAGKAWIHSAGNTSDWQDKYKFETSQSKFTTSMGDAASSIVEYFRNKGGIAFINVMANISVDCDCAGKNARPPHIHDIGILASLDPIALDRACIDLIRKTKENGTANWLQQLKYLIGENTIVVAEKHNIGSQEYNLIDIDGNKNLDNKNLDKYLLYVVIISLSFSLFIIGGIVIYLISKKRRKNKTELDTLMDKKDQ